MTRWFARSVLVVAIVGGLGIGSASQAHADVVFDETAQEAFGIDENGESTGNPGPLSAMWNAFISQAEGRRILEDMENAEATITIEVLPMDQVDDGKSWGTAGAVEWDTSTGEWIPTKIEIKISETTKGHLFGADTLHHELRHAEIKIAGGGLDFERDRHDQMHAGRDSLNHRFQLELDDWTENRRSRDPILDADTPIYDSIKARADDATRLGYVAQDLGAIFDLTPPPPTMTIEPVLDLAEMTGVRIAIEADIDQTKAQPASGCGQSEGGRTIVCPEDAFDLELNDLFGIGGLLNELIPHDGSTIELRLEMDTDGDSANDRPGEDFEDPVQGTDTTFGASYTPAGGWSMSVTTVDGETRSGARLIVEDDSFVFLVPMSEIPGGSDAGFRLVADQTTPDGYTTRDVSGISPSDSLAPVPAAVVSVGCGSTLLGPICGSQAHTHISSVIGHIGDFNELWLEFIFEVPWTMAPAVDLPSTALFWGLYTDSVSIGGQWSIHDGTTFGIAGDESDVFDLDMYLSPWGSVFVRQPGFGDSGGFLVGPDEPLVINTQTRYQLILDTDTYDRLADFPLTMARTMLGFSGPGTDWTMVSIDIGAVELVVPSG